MILYKLCQVYQYVIYNSKISVIIKSVKRRLINKRGKSMERRVVYSGKITPEITKSENCLEIINIINEYKINKEMKKILFLAAMKIIPVEKKNEDLIFHLESFQKNEKIYPEVSKSKYIQNVINDIKALDHYAFMDNLNKTIEFVKNEHIEF